MSEVDAWQLFLQENKNSIKEMIKTQLLRKLAAYLVYNLKSIDSWRKVYEEECYEDLEKVDFWVNGIGKSDEKLFKHVSTFGRNYRDCFDHYFLKETISDHSSFSDIFDFYQFLEHNGRGDWNFPCTWEDIIEEKAHQEKPSNVAASFFDIHCPKQVKSFFIQELAGELVEEESLWTQIYSHEPDDGIYHIFIYDIIMEIIDDLKDLTIADLKNHYPLECRRFQLKAENEKLLEQERVKKEHQRREELRIRGKSLVIELRKRALKSGLILPHNLYFGKNLSYWPQLKNIL